MPDFWGIWLTSAEKRVDVGTTALVATDQLARQRIDPPEQLTASRGLLGFECGERRLESVEFTVAEILVVTEVQTVAELGQCGDARVVGCDVGVSRRSNRTTTLLLTEHRRHLRRIVWRVPAVPALTLLLPHDVETTLRNASDEGHHVLFCLETGTQRTKVGERQ